MNSLYILGDSHSGRMANVAMDSISKKYGSYGEWSSHNANYYDKVFDHLDSGGNKIFHTISSNLFSFQSNNNKIVISSTPGRSALNFDYDFYEYMNDWDSENSIVMPWLGYIDIKNWLPQKNLKNYKSVKEVVDIYVENTLKKFKKSKIIFINPMPQFVVIVAARWANFSSDPNIDFEDRHEMHIEFTNALKEKCLSLGLHEPVNISEVLSADWIETGMQFKKNIKDIYNDHLRPEFYDKILSAILSKVEPLYEKNNIEKVLKSSAFVDIPTPEEKFLKKYDSDKEYSDYISRSIDSLTIFNSYNVKNKIKSHNINYYEDEDFIYAEKIFPEENILLKDADENFYYKLNKNGFRSMNFEKLDTSKKNILFMGCSITFGLGLPEGLSWADIFSKKISNLLNQQVNSYNISLPGAGVSINFKNFISFLNKCGKPDYVFMLLPETTRDITWDPESNVYINALINARDRNIDQVYRERLVVENNLFNAVSYINAIELICKELDIKLIWTSWNDISLDVYEKFNFKNIFRINFDHPLYLIPPTINNSKKNFDRQIKKDRKEYEKHFKMLSSLNVDKKQYWIIARDNVHPGSLFSEFFADEFFKEFKKRFTN